MYSRIKYFNYSDNSFHSFQKNFILNICKKIIPIKEELSINFNSPLPEVYWNFFKNYKKNDKELYILNSYDFFTIMLGTILPHHLDYITNFINNANYIYFSYEVIINKQLDQIGLLIHTNNHYKGSGVKLVSLDMFNDAKTVINKNISKEYYFFNTTNDLELTNDFINIKLHDLILLFYSKAKHIITSISENIKYLKLNNVTNVHYNIPTSYSIINNFIPFTIKSNYIYDVIFYGTLHIRLTHRHNILETIKNYCIIQNILYLQSDRLFDKEKNDILNQTKIVLHIPSISNLKHFPWQKISELMCKKVFFIIEENEEMYALNLDKTIIYYKSNDIDDLIQKITYYLNNEEKRKTVINNCYNYIYTMYNSEKLVESILKDTVIK